MSKKMLCRLLNENKEEASRKAEADANQLSDCVPDVRIDQVSRISPARLTCGSIGLSKQVKPC